MKYVGKTESFAMRLENMMGRDTQNSNQLGARRGA